MQKVQIIPGVIIKGITIGWGDYAQQVTIMVKMSFLKFSY